MTFTPYKKKSAPEGSAAEEASESPAEEAAEDKGSDVKAMVAAHSKVPDAQKAAYRKKVIAKARGTSAMQHIPDAWLKGKPGAPSDVKGGD